MSVQVLFRDPRRSGRPATFEELVDELTRVNVTQQALASCEKTLQAAIRRSLETEASR